jgi:hypothetical protein
MCANLHSTVLQADILLVASGKGTIAAQSIIHQSSAGVLFAAGYLHCIIINILLYQARGVLSLCESESE